jgi:anti-sigma factor ChrR (cupin superfamily)
MTEALHLAKFLTTGWRDCAFEPFHDGIEICRLVRGEPEVALLRYAPGASAPRHRHRGLETILVLEGSQSDEFGDYGPGTLVANPEGSIHSVISRDGCVVLIQWTRPVEML